MNQIFEVRKPDLLPYYNKAQSLLQKFDMCTSPTFPEVKTCVQMPWPNLPHLCQSRKRKAWKSLCAREESSLLLTHTKQLLNATEWLEVASLSFNLQSATGGIRSVITSCSESSLKIQRTGKHPKTSPKLSFGSPFKNPLQGILQWGTSTLLVSTRGWRNTQRSSLWSLWSPSGSS